jgi:hypothetical protein
MVVELLRQLNDWVAYKLMRSSCRRQLARTGAWPCMLQPPAEEAQTPRRYPPAK